MQIKKGDRLYCEGCMQEVEGVALEDVEVPYDAKIKMQCDDGYVVIVKGWLCSLIEINGEAF